MKWEHAFDTTTNSTARSSVCVHLYVNGRAEVTTAGQTVGIVQDTAYPWKDRVRLTITPQRPAVFTVSLRIPGWCRSPGLAINGKAEDLAAITRKGYARVRRKWQPGDRLELTLPMPVERVVATPQARQVCGRVALKRGPVVYCLEEVDNAPALNDLRLPRDAGLSCTTERALFGGVPVIKANALRRCTTPGDDALYSTCPPRFEKCRLTAVPYHLWAHREPGEMIVWIRE
jgi:DUF1680 family protein